jgi:4-amino-4-deoxy-L-arabinose transferase-like glycosyltransferase
MSKLSRKDLIIILAAALMVRVALMILLQTWEFKDDWAYGHEMGRLGQWLAEGRGFSLDGEAPTAKFPPVYPFIVGGAFALFGIYSKAAAVGLFLFHSACAAVTAVCLAVLGSHLFDRRAGLIAGFIWVAYPTSIFYSVIRIWYCELALMLLFVAVTVAVTTRPSLSHQRVMCLGGLSGLIVLTDTTMALYLPLLFCWILFAQGAKLPRQATLAVVWAIMAGVVTSPWLIRNWSALGTPLLGKSNIGLELFIGNNSFSSGTVHAKETEQAFAALDQEELTYYQSQPERVYYQFLQNKALAWIQAHPLGFLQLTARRIWYFWGLNLRVGREAWLHFAYFFPLVVLALVGLWHSRQRWRELAPLWLFPLLYPLPYYVTHVGHGRYSYPVEPFTMLLAATSLAIWSLRRKTVEDL